MAARDPLPLARGRLMPACARAAMHQLHATLGLAAAGAR